MGNLGMTGLPYSFLVDKLLNLNTVILLDLSTSRIYPLAFIWERSFRMGNI